MEQMPKIVQVDPSCYLHVAGDLFFSVVGVKSSHEVMGFVWVDLDHRFWQRDYPSAF